MRITVLTVPDCPNAPVVQERINAALGGLDAAVDLVEVADQDQAAHWGMTGSPTVLLDGVDPFAVPGAAPSVSCRLYRDADGRVEGSPSVAALSRALESAGVPVSAEAGPVPEVDVFAPVGRDGRGRLAPVEGGLRAVQQAVLRHFAATGHAPDAQVLAPAAASAGRAVAEVLAELADQDFLTLDEEGRIQAAYPFSALPTAHRVAIADGPVVSSMCALDALGIPAMLGRDAVITSADPVTGTPVTVTAAGGRMEWEPQAAVVFVGRRCCDGPAAAVCCDVLNFFAGPETARQWSHAHPDIVGGVLDQDRAVALGIEVFGGLLDATTAG